ncbi:hypothetical protein INT45_008262, partial [Circinella minor]
MNFPTTPIPCSTGKKQQQTSNTSEIFTESQPPLSSPSSQQQKQQQQLQAIQSIYTSTFSYIGNDFMDSIVHELRHWTQAQAVMVLQFMNQEEYKNLTNDTHEETYSQSTIGSTASIGRTIATVPSTSHERSPIQSTFTLDGSPPSLSNSDSTTTTNTTLYDTSSHNHSNDRYLVIRSSSYSSQQQQLENYLPNTALKIPPNQDTPFAKTLRDSSCSISERSFSGFSAYSTIHSFVGVRLDDDGGTSGNINKTVGVLCVMDPEPMDTKAIQFTEKLLKAVQSRLARELGRVIHEEKLTRAKNAAKMDAENKIKFLADMSHEIRTPMNAVIALTDLLLRERALLNTEQTEHLEVIQTSGHHLLTVINDILDISKINHDPKLKLENRRFSLRKCMKDALNMARHQASMSQPGKIVYVTEYPEEINDSIPLRQMIHEMEKANFLPPQKSHHTEKTRLELLWRIDSDVPDILMGDTMRLTQIMLNLCSNAVKFTKDGGIRVRIKRCVPTPALEQDPSTQTSLKQRYNAKIETMWTRAMRRTASNDGNNGETAAMTDMGEYSDNENDDEGRPLEKAILEISVTDTGIGIPADRLPRLFKSFSQIDISTARRYGGTGLGLTICGSLVNHMGGCLWVESEEEIGSCFALTLPLPVAAKGHHHHHHHRHHHHSSSVTTLGMDDTTGLESASTSSILASADSPGLSDAECNLSINSGLEESASVSSDVSAYQAATSPSMGSPRMATSQHETTELPQWSMFTPPHSSQTQSSTTTLSTTKEPIGQSQFIPGPNTNTDINTTTNTTTPSSSVSSSLLLTDIASDHPMDISIYNDDITNINTNHTTPSEEQQIQKHQHNNNNNNQDHHYPHLPSSNNSFSSTKTDSNNDNHPPRNTRHHSFKQTYHYHHHKKSTTAKDGNEENIAMLYPIKIMLAEDNVLNQKIAISILKRLGYHDVMVANNGCEVLELMRKVKFDVIFMDLYMPDMDGLEATRTIVAERESGASQNNSNNRPLLNVADVYIIALTASASRQDRQICIDAGMNDFISKPFTMMEMKASLKNCVSKRKRRRKQEDNHQHSHHHHHHHHNDRHFQTQQHAKDDPMIGVEHTATTMMRKSNCEMIHTPTSAGNNNNDDGNDKNAGSNSDGSSNNSSNDN